MNFSLYKSRRIYYNSTGNGPVIVLLHGFTESRKIWDHFVPNLALQFQVVTIDLPGHGESENVAAIHTMDGMAEVVHTVLVDLGIKRCLMVGHSMGGYVALAFAERYPHILTGLTLFHSHCFADSEQDRINRDRTIKLVLQDKFQFITAFIPSLFPSGTQQKYAADIDVLILNAEKMSKEGVVAALEGMKVRSEQTELLSHIDIPCLFIVGMEDSKAPLQRIWEMISLPKHSESLLLQQVGHMGFIEEPRKTLDAIRYFGFKVS